MARYLPVTNDAVLIAAILAPYLVVAGLLSTLVLAVGRHWWLTACAGAVTVALVAAQVPMFVGSVVSASDSPVLRVLSVNIMKGGADADALVEQARAADVVTAIELTPDLVRRLAAAGMDTELPYRVIAPLDGSSGIGLWSRYPLSDGVIGSDYFLSSVHAEVAVPQAESAPVVAAVHITAPWPSSIREWQRSVAATGAIMRRLAESAGTGAVVVAGDFNSTFDMVEFRELLTDGYHDAAEQTGAGLSQTFPAHVRVPPLIGIDHVLVRNGETVSATTVAIAGSDHRGVAATVRLPGGKGA